MQSFLGRLVLNSLALFVLTQLYSGVYFAQGSDLVDYVLAGLVFGLANALIKPLLIIFTLPINFATLGLFTLVINGAVLWLVAGFTALEVRTFGASILGALLLSILSYFLNNLFKDKRNQ